MNNVFLFCEQELTSLKTKYEAKDYKSGKKHQKLNASKSVLPGNGAKGMWCTVSFVY